MGIAYIKVSQRSKHLAPSFHSQEKNLEKHNYINDINIRHTFRKPSVIAFLEDLFNV